MITADERYQSLARHRKVQIARKIEDFEKALQDAVDAWKLLKSAQDEAWLDYQIAGRNDDVSAETLDALSEVCELQHDRELIKYLALNA